MGWSEQGSKRDVRLILPLTPRTAADTTATENGMDSLQTLPPDATTATIVAATQRDGACIMRDVLDTAMVARINAEVAPYVAQASAGHDDFTGRQTQRIGALVARSPLCRDVVMNRQVLAAAQAYLKPYCSRIQLHLTQLIRILPGQGAQPLHRDRLAWGGYLPDTIEPQFNTIWALTDFTAANGATRVIPGSHLWAKERKALDEETVQAEMSQGSVLIYNGTVVHSGGQNRSASARLGMNITYCLSWLRQEENQFLSCPPEIARTLDPELQELLGYTMANYALGYYSSPQPFSASLPDTLPPELALGRRPREDVKYSGFS
jgi:ectoine hydroxylase-related dioxygenase (phytanoyl-CoA dioxygenase family)